MALGSKRRNFSRAFSRGFKRFRTAAGPIVSTALRFANSGSRTLTRTRNSRGAEYGNITFQNDEHQIYRRKRAPRRVRVRARKQWKRFNFMLNKSLAMHSVVIPTTQAITLTPTNGSTAQTMASYTIYGGGANSTTPGTQTNPANGDLDYIMRAHSAYSGTTANAPSYKFRFKSAVMNLTVKNTVDNTVESARGGLVFIDLYHVVCRKSTTDSAAGGAIQTVWADAIQHTGTMNALNTVNIQSDGLTPFDIGQFGEQYTIRRVRRVRLSSGQVFSTQIRDPADYIIEQDDIARWDHLANKTEGFLIVAYNPSADPTTGVRGIVAIEINCNKKYHYTVNDESLNSAGRGNLI